MSIRSELERAIDDARRRALTSIAPDADHSSMPAVRVEHPANPQHGDFASNAAMQLAPIARTAPMRIAEAIRNELVLAAGVATVEVAPPGFVNLRLEPAWVAGQLGEILEAGEAYGRVRAADPRAINVEFVSANPTGPLTIGNARGAFVGDVLSRVLEASGHRVTREYYFNDYNEQIRNLGLTLLALRHGEPIPPDGYHGAYVGELMAE